MEQTIEWKPAARIKVYANGRTFRDLVIDSLTFLDTPEINDTTFECCSFSQTHIASNTIKHASFEDCQLTDSVIRDIVCITSDFVDTSFKYVAFGAVFINCNFYGVDFDLCDFADRCRFIDCIFDACSFSRTSVAAPAETFSSSQLHNCRDIPFVPMVCPETGKFIGYKKGVANYGGSLKEVVIKLLIPEGAARSSATGRKCRCQFARVLSIEGIGSIHGLTFNEARSFFDHAFIYRTGEVVYPNKYDENRWDECSNGIHFFMSRQEAIDY